jgi:hypothetical protein
MRIAAVLFVGVGLTGCSGPSSEQRCYEANRAVAESLQKAAESRGGVNSEWVNALLAAREWKEAECSSLIEKARRFFSGAK